MHPKVITTVMDSEKVPLVTHDYYRNHNRNTAAVGALYTAVMRMIANYTSARYCSKPTYSVMKNSKSFSNYHCHFSLRFELGYIIYLFVCFTDF